MFYLLFLYLITCRKKAEHRQFGLSKEALAWHLASVLLD